MMMSGSKWLVGTAVTVLLIALASASEETDDSSSDRTKRQYSRRPVSRNPIPFTETYSPEDDGVVVYDPAGLGFEIQKPGSLHYQYHQKSEPAIKPTHYPQPKPVVYKEPAYSPEPLYRPAVYQNEKPYVSPYPTSEYSEDYAYYCPKVAGYESHCRPVKDCAIWYDAVLATPGAACQLPDGNPGDCCPALPHNNPDASGLKKVTRKNVKIENQCIDIYSVNAAAHAGRFQLRLLDETEKLLQANNITIRRNSAEYTHLLFFQTTEKAQEMSRGALVGVATTRELGKRFQLTSDQAAYGLQHFNLRDTILSDTCPVDPVCDEKTARSPFRTLDGSCNNLKNSFWGKSRTQFQRSLNPEYSDGVWQPRRSVSGSELPSPRLVSISVVIDIDAPHETDTNWVTLYGQFVDHDLTSTPVFRMNANGMGIQCCTEDGKLLNNTELLHPECLPITIPADDPFFSKFGQRCMSFVRSTPAPRFDCSFGHGEQMNQLTHFLDHSNVYGSDDEEAAALRTFKKGTLKVTPRKGHHELDLLPPDNEADGNCTLSKLVSGIDPPPQVKCFKAGDARSNENPNLAVTHTVFMREHNRLAAELSYLNPLWDDERLYQEARRILIAQMQHITYNEWLPTVIGRDKMQELALCPLDEGFSKDYDADTNPTILNEFATAAFRFGHTLLQGKNDLINHKRRKEAHIVLRQHFFKSQVVYTPGNLDKFLIGLATQPMQQFDNWFTEEITNHLFEEEGKGFGMDLVALNLQRGRDHGIPGYNFYRSLCGLPHAQKFNDLLDVIPAEIVERFQLLYETVDDIDLFIGAVSERPARDAILGPTFQCIVADQFLKLKRGDRFFYDLGGQPGSFSEEQLYQIRQVSFARLVCDNSHVRSTQPLVFKSPSPSNPIVDCESASIPRVNLLPWMDGYVDPYKKPYVTPYKKY